MSEIGSDFRELKEPNRVKFPEFLSHRNPNDGNYRRLQQSLDIGYLENRGDALEKTLLTLLNIEDVRSFLAEHLKGEILFDCGGGRKEFMRDFAMELKVGTYVNLDGKLDKYFVTEEFLSYNEPVGDKDDSKFSLGIRKPRMEKDTEVQGLSGEMLSVISRLPENSSSFVINGVDKFSNTDDSAYWRALAIEIARATKKSGVVFGGNSELFKYLDRKVFIDTRIIKAEDTVGIFEKI